MAIYKKRPPEEPKFHAKQYDGTNAESFVGFLRCGAKCITTNEGYGLLRHEVSVMIGDASLPVTKGQWVVYDADGGARVMSNEDFVLEFQPEISEVLVRASHAKVDSEESEPAEKGECRHPHIFSVPYCSGIIQVKCTSCGAVVGNCESHEKKASQVKI